MKLCGYCGRENEDAAVNCVECGTSLVPESSGASGDVVHWFPHSPIALALKIGFASVLICTGIFYAVGRVTLDMFRMFHTGGGVPAYYNLMFVHTVVTWTVFSIGALLFTFFVCHDRLPKELHVIVTVIATLGVIVLLTVGPGFASDLVYISLLLPAFLLGAVAGFPGGYYIGASLQILFGAWLLGWFEKRRPVENTDKP